MRRTFLLIPLIFSFGCATTEPSKDVDYAISSKFKLDSIHVLAVIPSVDASDSLSKALLADYADKVYDFLVMELMKVPSFDIVERKDMDEVLKELEFSHSPFSFKEYAPRLGKMLGADMVAYFSVLNVEKIIYPIGYSELGWRYEITGSLKIIDVETGRLLYQATSTVDGSDLLSILKKLTVRCTSPLKHRP